MKKLFAFLCLLIPIIGYPDNDRIMMCDKIITSRPGVAPLEYKNKYHFEWKDANHMWINNIPVSYNIWYDCISKSIKENTYSTEHNFELRKMHSEVYPVTDNQANCPVLYKNHVYMAVLTPNDSERLIHLSIGVGEDKDHLVYSPNITGPYWSEFIERSHAISNWVVCHRQMNEDCNCYTTEGEELHLEKDMIFKAEEIYENNVLASAQIQTDDNVVRNISLSSYQDLCDKSHNL